MSQREDCIQLTIRCDGQFLSVEFLADRLRRSLSPEFEMSQMRSVDVDAPVDGDMLTLTFRPADAGCDRELSHQCERVAAHCDLLDELNVPNGAKAIAIALHLHWSGEHRARFGEPANPSTVKRWRTERSLRRGGKGAPAPRRHEKGPKRVVRGLRQHHAIRTTASGSGMKEGYRIAIAELQTVNDGAHRFYGKPDMPLKPFSYETFRRDCLALRRRNSRRR